MSEYTAIIGGISTRPTTPLKSILKWCGNCLNLLVLTGCLFCASATCNVCAQENPAASPSISTDPNEMSKQISELRALVLQLQAQVKELQAQPKVAQAAVSSNEVQPVVGDLSPGDAQSLRVPQTAPSSTTVERGFLRGTSVNFAVDTYYAYNFNDPIGRLNLLRVYDVSSNAFSLNQADIVLENAPHPANGQPFWSAPRSPIRASDGNFARKCCE